MDNIDYRKLKKDSLNKVDSSGIMLLIIAAKNASDKEIFRFAEGNNLDISGYIKE